MSEEAGNSDQMPEPKSQLPHLSISAHVVVQLGEELVTDVEQALLELAKNAYDADSRSCEIKIESDWILSDSDQAYELLFGKAKGPAQKVGRLRIRDYGTGISKEAVTDGWLKISASLKRVQGSNRKRKTDLGRTPVGDKGLGRLATMKLGKVLRMKTAVAPESEWRTTMFSWSEFTQDRTLDEVQVLVGVDTLEEVTGSGTIIEVIGLNDYERWSDARYLEKQVIPHLSSLINPFKAFDNFEISISNGRQNYDLHSLDDGVLNLSSAKFKFSWDGKKMIQETWIASSLFRGLRGEENAKRFREMFGDKERPALISWLQKDKKIKEKGISFDVPRPWFCKFSDEMDGSVFPTDRRFPGGVDPGAFDSEIYYFMFHESVKEKLVAAQISSETLQAMSQVSIYRDGFRVRAQQDWLRLSEGTTSGSSFYGLRPANVIGYFSIGNENNPGLVEKSDREGFIDNSEFRGFMVLGLKGRDYANSVLEAVRKSVREFSKIQENGDAPKNRKQLVEALGVTSQKTEDGFIRLQREISDARNALAASRAAVINWEATGSSAFNPEFKKNVDGADARIAQVDKSLQEIGANVRRQTAASMQLADISEDNEDYSSRLLDAAAVGLAARSLTHELHELIRQLREGVAVVVATNKKIKDPNLSTAARLLTGVAREFGKIISTIDPMLPGTRLIKENIDLASFLSEFAEGRESTAHRFEVGFSISGARPPNYIIRFSRTRLLQIVENLFQNSIYWLRKGPLPDPQVKRIDVTITEKGFNWSDSGPGVKPSLEASIFDAYVSDKPKSEGSGLGLHLVSTFLELEKCTISLGEQKNSLGRKSSFELDLSGAWIENQQPALSSR